MEANENNPREKIKTTKIHIDEVEFNYWSDSVIKSLKNLTINIEIREIPKNGEDADKPKFLIKSSDENLEIVINTRIPLKAIAALIGSILGAAWIIIKNLDNIISTN